ncbi:hypothetical protein D3C78_1376230 [compost metagenome]
MAQIALAVVRVGGVQLRFWRVRAVHVPGEQAADLESFLELAHTVRQEGQGAGGTRRMADAQLRHGLVHGLEPVIQALAPADVRRDDGFADFRCHQLGQPFVDLAEAALFQQ